jgi:putative ABC transport system substrate-binding protein
MAKRLEFLREVAPNARLIALLMNPDNLNYDVDVKAAQEAARNLDRQTTIVHAKSPTVLDGAFETIVQKRAGAVLVASDPMFLGHVTDARSFCEIRAPRRSVDARAASAGLLLSYGTSIAWMYRGGGYMPVAF